MDGWIPCNRKPPEEQKRPAKPGIVMDIERSSPKTLCQVLVATDRSERGIESKISKRRAARCSGRDTVFANVSKSQPRIIFVVDQRASPFRNFLIDAGSWQKSVSSSSSGRKTRSRAWKRMRFTARRCHRFPCTSPQKSST